jgi:hypothetical protein
MKDFKNQVTDLGESSGVLPSIDEQNFKDYLETVLKEVKKTR